MLVRIEVYQSNKFSLLPSQPQQSNTLLAGTPLPSRQLQQGLDLLRHVQLLSQGFSKLLNSFEIPLQPEESVVLKIEHRDCHLVAEVAYL